MTTQDLDHTLRRLYLLTAVLTVAGCCFFLQQRGWKPALTFLLAALLSLLNLWFFDWLSRRIASPGNQPKSRRSNLFVVRYFILFGVAYATVNALGFDPAAFVSGLLASTAAVLISSSIEIVFTLLGKPSSR